MTGELVVVLAGGLSHEREVSLRSGRRAAQSLRDVGLEVLELDVSSSLLEKLRSWASPSSSRCSTAVPARTGRCVRRSS